MGIIACSFLGVRASRCYWKQHLRVVLARPQLKMFFYKSGISGSFTVKLYQRIDLEYYYSGCNSSQITEVACANGSTSLLALSIPANLEETYTIRPFGSGRCFLPPPKNYWEMRTNLVLRQFWWKVFDKVILENNFSSKTCQFRNKKETREFKHLQFYGSNHLSPKLTKNLICRNIH